MKNTKRNIFSTHTTTVITNAIATVVFVLFSSSAFAERYLVTLKNEAAFKKVHAQFVLARTTHLSALGLFNSQNSAVEKSGANSLMVEDSLVHLKTLVVNTTDSDAIEVLSGHSEVDFIEKEMFHPSPIPVGGYKLSQAWDYQLSSQQTMEDESDPVGPVVTEKTPYGIIMVKAPQAWAKGYRGQGSRVAVLDTGIDMNHVALKNQIEKTKDFVGDNNAPYGVADHIGHGSHVAGTIAGAALRNGFSGVAPQAKLHIGRVCGDKGCSNIAVVQGINWAVSERVDVISMSLGGSVGSSSEEKAIQTAEKAGVVVVAASGNDGTDSVSFPAAFPYAIAVGAVDKTETKAKFSQWGPELSVVAPGVDVLSSVPEGTGREAEVKISKNNGNEEPVLATSFLGSAEVVAGAKGYLVYAGLGKPEEIANVNLSGKFALIKRGEIKFQEKATNALNAGATGVVIFNNEPGLLQGAITPDGSIIPIPVVMIEQKVGEAVQKLLASGGEAEVSIKTVVSDFASMSGTSMATPHVSGVVALIKSANKNLTPEQVREVLTSTCKPLEPNSNNEYGHGLVNSEKAVEKALLVK